MRHLPVFPTAVAAGRFARGDDVIPPSGEPGPEEGWMEVSGMTLDPDLFVVGIQGDSMKPKLYSGDYAIFRKGVVSGGGHLGTLLAECQSYHDRDTGAEFTIKDVEARVEHDEDSREILVEVRLIPRNKAWGPAWSLRQADGVDFHAWARFVKVVE